MLAAASGLWWVASSGPPPVPDAPTAKGDWTLHVGIKRQEQTQRHVAGQRFVDGDQLGFFYSSPVAGNLVLLFVDDAGQRTALVPQVGDAAMAVPAGSEVRLDAGGQLTATRGCEWLVGVFSTAPFSRTQVETRLAVRPATRDQRCGLELRARPEWSIQIIELER